VFLLAAWYRYHWPAAPFLDADGWGYLWSGLKKLTGGHFELIFGREYVYPALVMGELFVFGFDGITYVQHALGLLSGVLLLCCCHLIDGIARDRSASAENRVRPCWTGLGLTAIYLGNFNTFFYEHTIRPEGIFPCFALASVLLNLLMIAGQRDGSFPRRLLWVGGANLVLTAVLVLLRPSFRLGALCANIPFALLLLRREYSLARRMTVAGLALLVAAGVWLPQSLYSAGSRWSVRLMTERLFSGHCDLISRQIDADVAANRPGPYDEKWLAAVDASVARKLAESRRPENNPWAALGFNADYIIVTGNPLAPYFPDTLAGDQAMAAFCKHYYFRAALHQPLAMTAKVLRQIKIFYEFGMGFDHLHFRWQHFKTGRALTDGGHVSPRFFYNESYEKLQTGPPYSTMVAASEDASAYQDACRQLKGTAKRFYNPWLILVADKVCWMLHAVFVAAALGLSAALVFARRPANPIRTLMWVQWQVFSYSFGGCLATAVAFMVVDRYAQAFDALVLVSTYASGVFVWAAYRELCRGERGFDPEKKSLARAGGGALK
jgi:hypothetical protein